MANNVAFRACIHPSTYSCLYILISLILIINGEFEPQHYDTATLTLEGQDLIEYSCKLSEPQIKKLRVLTELVNGFTDTRSIISLR